LAPQAYANVDQPLLNVMVQPKAEDGFQPRHVRGGPAWVSRDKFTIEAKAPVHITSQALDGRASRTLLTLPPALSGALRVLLEERFQLKVRRATEQRDVYALTVDKDGLNKTAVMTPVPGDCMTVEDYAASAAAAAPVEERMKTATTFRICGRSSNGIYNSFTFGQLAVSLQNGGLLGDVVVDRTGIDAPFNFEMVLGTRAEGSVEDRIARALARLGLKLDIVKGSAEYLVIESVQKLRLEEAQGGRR